jgi:hypothetical protein
MANISDLKDLPGHVTTIVNTQALLTWLRFGTTDPPIPTAPSLQNLRKQGRLKSPSRHPFPVVKSSPSREGAAHPDRRQKLHPTLP